MAKSNNAANLNALVARTLQERWRRFRKAFKRCRRKCTANAVHDLRVATRRLMAALEIFRTFLDGQAVDQAHRLLKKQVALFGPLRDVQVQWQYISPMRPHFPELKAVCKALQKQERKRIRRVKSKLKRLKIGKLERLCNGQLKRLRVRRKNSNQQRRQIAALRYAVDAAFKKVADRRHQIDPSDTASIHRTRVAFKKFRYMMEVLRPILTGITRKHFREMVAYQTMMGTVQDLEVILISLKKIAQEKSAKRDRRLKRVVKELQRWRADAIEHYFKSADKLYGFWQLPSPSPAGTISPVKPP